MTILILTVGTGTQGDHSNLARGLVNSINQTAPCLYWLIPSSHPTSVAVFLGEKTLLSAGSGVR